MQEIPVEEDGLGVDSAEYQQRIFKELDGKNDPILAPLLVSTSKLVGEYHCVLNLLHSTENLSPMDCKLYVFSDSLMVAVSSKVLRQKREPITGIMDVAGTKALTRLASVRDSWLRRSTGKFKMLYWLDLRQCNLKYENSSELIVRYAFRTKEAHHSPGCEPRVITRIASFCLEFVDPEHSELIRNEVQEKLEDAMLRLDVDLRKSTRRRSARPTTNRWSRHSSSGSTSPSLERRKSILALTRRGNSSPELNRRTLQRRSAR